MMRLLLPAITLVAALNSFPASAQDAPEGLPPALADEYRDLQNELMVENLRGQVEAKRKANAIDYKTAATNYKEAAEAFRDAEIAAHQAALAGRSYPDIRINSARLFQISDPARECNAKYFVEWKCYGGDASADPPIFPDKCSFTADEKMCGQPGASNQPVMFEIEYACADRVKQQRVPFGESVHLTCRDNAE
ncbi:hypothetical protein [Cucumibacter marinus]|uniref:hypothetical protein n=1 Tax=Cucumibacter marinus TaxID=1121252 RepID=UPI00041ECDD9|nr:hypothetical protein [Cucumibacter marinus]